MARHGSDAEKAYLMALTEDTATSDGPAHASPKPLSLCGRIQKFFDDAAERLKNFEWVITLVKVAVFVAALVVIPALEKRVDHLQTELSSLKAAADNLSVDMMTFERDRSSLQAMFVDLNSTDTRKEIEDLRAANTFQQFLRGQAQGAATSAQGALNKIAALSSAVSQIQNDIRKAQGIVSDLSSAVVRYSDVVGLKTTYSGYERPFYVSVRGDVPISDKGWRTIMAVPNAGAIVPSTSWEAFRIVREGGV